MLAIGQIALATILVIGSGLLIQNFTRLLNYDQGFTNENVLAVPMNMRGLEDPEFLPFYEQALESIQALPGVKSAALSLRTPLETVGFKIPFRLENAREQNATGMFHPISSDYFKTVDIRLLSGRQFDNRDRSGAPAVAIINETFARIFLPSGNAAGQILRIDFDGEQKVLIVGIVADVKPETTTIVEPELYLPYQQFPMQGMKMLIRTTGDPISYVTPVKERIRKHTPNIPLDNLYTLEQRVSKTLAPIRFSTVLSVAFAFLALTLAALGIYGVMSYTVARRAKEIGIRRALGAPESTVLWKIFHQGFAMAVVGLILGCLGALSVVRWIAAIFPSPVPLSFLTYGFLACVLIGVTSLACFLPALRALRLNPIEVLRND